MTVMPQNNQVEYDNADYSEQDQYVAPAPPVEISEPVVEVYEQPVVEEYYNNYDSSEREFDNYNKAF
jgi:hypothetical protein